MDINVNNDERTRSIINVSSFSIRPKFEIFSRLAREVNIGIFSLMFITGVVFFHLYNWHFGNLKYAIESNKVNFQNPDALLIELGEQTQERLLTELVLNEKETNSIRTSLDRKDIQKIIFDRTKSIFDLRLQTMICTVPIVQIKVLVFDYILFLLYLGLLIYFWINRKIFQISYSLKNCMNDNSDSDSVDDLIVSLNFFIYPDQKKYKYTESILSFFSFSFLCLIISNIFEVYYKHEFSYEIPISHQPGWVVFKYHFGITTTAAAIGLYLSLRLFKSTEKQLFHARNLLILLRWYDSLRSAMFFCFDKHYDPLVKGRNFVEYREYKSDNELQLVFTVQKKSKLKSDALHGKIDLPARLKFFLENRLNHESTKSTTEDDFLGRLLNREEETMKEFFIDLFENDSNKSNAIAEQFVRITNEKREELLAKETDRIRMIIAKGDNRQAINEAKNIVDQKKYKQFQNDMDSISNRYEKLENLYQKNLISVSEYLIESSKLTNDLLTTLSKSDEID